METIYEVGRMAHGAEGIAHGAWAWRKGAKGIEHSLKRLAHGLKKYMLFKPCALLARLNIVQKSSEAN